MDKLIGGLVTLIIVVGLIFWAYNNPSGIGAGVNSGASKVENKVTNFNYNGSVSPGVGQTAP
jgi:hypothetical protein